LQITLTLFLKKIIIAANPQNWDKNWDSGTDLHQLTTKEYTTHKKHSSIQLYNNPLTPTI